MSARRLARLRPPRGERRTVLATAGLGVAQTGVALAVPAAVSRIASASGAESLAAAPWLAACLALVTVHAAAGFAAARLLARAESRVAGELRRRVYAHLQSLPLPWFARRRPGELLELFAGDVESVASFATRAPGAVLPLALTLVGASALALRIDAGVLLAFGLVLPPLVLAVKRLARPVAGLSRSLAESHAALLGLVQENLENLEAIKTSTAEASETERCARADAAVRRARDAQLRRQLAIGPAIQVGAAVGVLAIALAVTRGPGLAPGALVAAILYALLFARALRGAADLHVQRQEARGAAARLDAVLAVPPERGEVHAGARPPLRGALELRELRFAHPGAPPVLRGVSLRVDAGELVALVGSNGAGKSTLAELLVRLREPDAGVVLLDGHALRDLEREWLRRHVVLASQRVQLFDRSVRENIALGRPDATPRQIREAAERAGAHAFVASLRRGYETAVGERGVRLSGGQRQRIALARALLAEPRLLILDEATSMLDADGESDFLRRNRDWLRGRTTLLVTHRPASLRLVDRVIELRDGRAHERGRARAARAGRTRERRAAGPTPRSRPL